MNSSTITRRKIFKAGLWVLLAFTLSQFIRLGGNLVVTRLLEPEMFGIMALVYALIYGVNMFSDIGLWSFVVREKNANDTHMLNVVWSMQIARGLVIFFSIIIVAAAFWGIQHLQLFEMNGVYAESIFPVVLAAAAFSGLILAFRSMAPAVMSRQMKRGKLETIELLAQFLGAVVMVIWAYTSPSIWSLLSAAIVTAIFKTWGIYIAFDFRHKFVWDKAVVKKVYDFGKWIFIASVLTYLAQQGDRLFLGGSVSPAILGVYSIAFMLSNALVAVNQQLTSKVLFPVFSEANHQNPQKLKSLYYRARLRLDSLVFLVAGSLLALAPDLIAFLYDERYHAAGWMLQIMIVGGVAAALLNAGQECLSAIGQTKVRMQVMFVRFLALIVLLPLGLAWYDVPGAIWAVAISSWFGVPVLLFKMKQFNLLSLFSELRLTPLILVGYFITAWSIRFV